MNSYSFGVPQEIKPGELHYGYIEYNYFTVREVYIDKRQNGEYHIRPDKLNPGDFLKIFKENFNGFEIDIIDPTGILGLDFPIYLIAKTEMQKLSIINIFEKMNDIIEKKLNFKGAENERRNF